MSTEECFPRIRGLGSIAFKEHTLELLVASVEVPARAGKALRDLLARSVEFGMGVVYVLPEEAPGRQPMIFSTKRACPSCHTSYPEPDPRLFSFNSKHGWCESCYGTGVSLEGFDAEQTGEEVWWNAWYEGEAKACRACQGDRFEPAGACSALSGTLDRRSCALRSQTRNAFSPH